jgi:hypothetical protein
VNRLQPFVALSCVAAFSCVAHAQELRLRDRSIPLSAAYDGARGRLVVLGNRGETSELTAGGAWRQRAVPLRAFMQPQVCFDSSRAVTWLLDNDLSAANLDLVMAKYDGVAWTDVAPATMPATRTGFASAYDSARARVLLFGGADQQGTPLGDTWTFDGLTWTQQFPASAPSARQKAALAEDSVRGRVVLFGGYSNAPLDDTWEWDGVTWQARSATVRPTVRYSTSMAFDPARARTVLFGGIASSSSVSVDDTWEWNGQVWSQVVSATPGPTARHQAAAAFDPGLGEVVVLGGLSYGQLNRDAWSFDGVRWQSVALPTQRPFLPRAALAVEAQGDAILAFGGLDAAEVPTADTWRWQAGSWSRLPVTGPQARIDSAVCTDNQFTWMFGGTDYLASSPLYGDLWKWDGANWSQVIAAGPSPRTGASMVFNQARNRIVLFGGRDSSGLLGDTWTFDGTAWQQQQPLVAPPPRASHAMAYDLILDRAILVGGEWMTDTWQWDGANWSLVPGAYLSFPGHATAAFDLQRLQVVVRIADNGVAMGWSFDGQAWTSIGSLPGFYGTATIHDFDGRVLGFPYPHGLVLADGANLHTLSATAAKANQYGSGCGTGALHVGVDGWPGLTTPSFAIEVQGAPSSSFAALVGAVQSASIPMAGCTLLVQPGQLLALLPTSGFGIATAPLTVPSNSAFLGVNLFFQAAALDPLAPAGIALSRGLQIVVGD